MPVGGFAHDLDVVLLLEDGAEPAAHDRVVVRDEDADLGLVTHRPKSLPRNPRSPASDVSTPGGCSTSSIGPRPMGTTAKLWYGMLARTIVPCPASLRTTSWPPAASAR